ncbi:MAG: hypothetical protein PHS07_03460 [Patescibacteria group bacterium]|jgi:hypothetical protein|nr:hypothetical protein [Patescibacteria group bacterium]
MVSNEQESSGNGNYLPEVVWIYKGVDDRYYYSALGPDYPQDRPISQINCGQDSFEIAFELVRQINFGQPEQRQAVLDLLEKNQRITRKKHATSPN